MLQKEFNIFGVALEEFALRIRAVDEQPDAQRQFGFAGEGDDLLRDAVFEYPEGFLIEPGDELAGGVVNAEGERHQVDLGVEDCLLGAHAKSRRGRAATTEQFQVREGLGGVGFDSSINASVNTLLRVEEVPEEVPA